MTSFFQHCGVYTWGAFAPELFLVGLAIVLLMIDCFWKSFPKKTLAIIGALGVFGTSYALCDAMCLFPFLACIATGLTLLLAHQYAPITEETCGEGRFAEGTGEFYVLPLFACAGISLLCKAQDFVMFFVGLEALSLSSYAMAGFYKRNHGSVEAGVKYLITGALSTGFLVFGIAWYFGMTGTFVISQQVVFAALATPLWKGLFLALAMVFAAVAFKTGAFPMHVWIPDVYQGAPTPVTAFLSVASKVAGFTALLIVLLPFQGSMEGAVHIALFLTVVTAATLLVGNLGAIWQTNMKRLLGYSSIAQAGFIFPLCLVAFNQPVNFMVALYLVAYMVATMGAFFALAQIRIARGSDEISAFRGLGKTNPLAAFCVVVFFASLAGVPLTAGFTAKLASFQAVLQMMENLPSLELVWWLLPVMIVCAATGFYYYFKVIRAMYWVSAREEDSPVRIPFISGLVMALCVLVILILGIFPLS